MGTVLVVTGGILVVLSILLAFTFYGMAAAALGVVCIAVGTLLLVRRSRPVGGGPGTERRWH